MLGHLYTIPTRDILKSNDHSYQVDIACQIGLGVSLNGIALLSYSLQYCVYTN
jgi:hypothetical protein